MELRVHPTLVPEKALLASVEGEKNAIMVQANALGPTGYYGAGAGAGPTASAVVADLVDAARIHSVDPSGRVPHLAFQPDAMSDAAVLPADDFVCAHYFRLQVADQLGVMAEVARLLADTEISIESILQKDPTTAGVEDADIIIMTKPVREGRLMEALEQIQALPYCREGIVRMRVSEFED